MTTFTKLYIAGGLGLLGLFAFADMAGGLMPTFVTRGTIDTKSRQGYWYTYKKPPPSSSSYGSPGRSPSGGGYGGGGSSGGK